MASFANPSMAERLRIVADNLGCVYAPAPLEEGDDLRALINHLRATSGKRLTNVRQLGAGRSPDDEESV
jgi:hypothetical protein